MNTKRDDFKGAKIGTELKNEIKPLDVYQIIVFLGIITLVFAFQTSDELSSTIEENLWGHMIIEHSLFFFLGYEISFVFQKIRRIITSMKQKHMNSMYSNEPLQSVYDRKPESLNIKNDRYIWIALIFIILTIWHVPAIFDVANYDNLVHLIQHTSFVIVGICIYQCIRKFDLSFILVLLLLTCGTMGITGLFLALSNHVIYSSYTIQDHQDTGNYMIIMTITMTIIVFPLLLIRKTIKIIRDKNTY